MNCGDRAANQSHPELTVSRYRDEETSPSRWQETGEVVIRSQVTKGTEAKPPEDSTVILLRGRDQVRWREGSGPELYEVYVTHSKG